MSGTNQSKLVTNQEKMNLGDANASNTCISTKDEDVAAAENSTTENNKLQDGNMEGNLQLQIQEAVAATISRASRNSAAFEQQQINSSNSCTSVSAFENALDFASSSSEDQEKLQNEVLRNIETYEHCESKDPVECDQFINLSEVQNTLETNLQTQDLNDSSNRKILDNLIQNKDLSDEPKDANHFNDYTACNSSADDVQIKQDMQEKKQVQEPDEASNSEVSSREGMSVDSKQEKNLNECNSNRLDGDNSIGICNNEEDGQNISEENLQVQEVAVADSRESVSSVPEEDLNNCVYNSRSENSINVESSREVEDTVAEHLQTPESVSSHSEDDRDTKPTANSAESRDLIEDALQVENNAGYVDSKESAEDLLIDKDETSCSKADVDINIRSENNINVESSREVEDTVAEHLQTPESVSSHSEDDRDTKPTANSAESRDLIEDALQVENNAGYVDSKESAEDLLIDKDETSCSKADVDINSRSENNINVESSREVEDTVAEHLQTQESVSSHTEDGQDTKPTANSAESRDPIEDALQVENNAGYVDSKESAEDLLIDRDQTSCSKPDADIDNLREVQHAIEGTQKGIDVSDSQMFTNEDLPIENEEESTSNNDSNVDNADISNTESSLEGQFTSEETQKAQEAVSIISNEIFSNKDFPKDLKQTSQLTLENLLMQKEAEDPKRVFTKVTETPDVVVAESHPENLNHAISKMQDEDVFPVIEIVEDGSEIQEIIEVIDVDESKNVSESMSKSPYIGSACIEILSDEDEDVQIQETVEQNSIVQEAAKVDTVEIPKNELEDILQQVKLLTSTEYLLFYLKLPPKCDDETTTGNLSDTLGSKFGNNEITISGKNKLILKAIDASIRETSKNTVQNIVDRVKDLTIKEYLWFRSNLPTDCINSNLQHCILPHTSETSRTILWLKTHLEESADSMLLKHDVFKRYQTFCKQTGIQLLSASRFGKLINQVFPNIGRKRLRVRGSSAYYYVGLQPRTKLDTPRLPKVSENLQQKRLTDENETVKCENESEDVDSNNQFDEQKIFVKELNYSCSSNQGNESDDSYKSNQLDGQTIIVHDPLALLNMSTSDDKLLNDASFHQSYDQDVPKSGHFDRNLRSRSSYHQFSSSRSRNSTSVINSSVRKIKYKEYRHPSVQKVFKEFNTIVLPAEVFKLNINPTIALDNSEMNNWYAEHIKAFAQKLSSMVIRKEVRSQNFNVLFTCCNDGFEVSDSYAKQLNDLKEKLSNITVRKSDSSSNYEVARTSSNVLPEVARTSSNVLPEQSYAASKPCYEPIRITKQLGNHKIKSDNECAKFTVSADSAVNILQGRRIKHLSVQRLYKKFKGIALPQEVFNTDVDPVIILDSGEVIEWYIKQVDYLKHQLSNVNHSVMSSTTDMKIHVDSPRPSVSSPRPSVSSPRLSVSSPRPTVSSPRPSVSSSRHSKAKMMNFCEIDSSDYDSDNVIKEENQPEVDPIALGEKNSDILQTILENTMVSMASDCSKINVSEISHHIATDVVNEPAYTYATIKNENEQQRSCTRKKRSVLNDEDADEIEQKRKRFYCSKITIPYHTIQQANVCEQPLSSSIEQIPYSQEKPVETCSSPFSDEAEGFVCKFCSLVFDQRKEFLNHRKVHLYCKTCKRKLKSVDAMRQHLINHCSLNNIKNKPLLKLHRVDSVPSFVEKYARAFSEPVLYATENSGVAVNHKDVIAKTVAYITNKTGSKSCAREVLLCRSNGVLSVSATNLSGECIELDKTKTNLNQIRTYSKLPRCTTVRILKTASKPNTQIQTPIVSMASTVVSSENQQEQIPHQTQQEPMFQLKNTISNNLNKILLLSNSGSQSQIQSPNILYGTLFVNNASGQSTPNICLNSSLYNPTVTASGIDCALNTNPSCSNPDLQQPPTFMQIVESPNTSLMQYAAPVSQNNTLVAFEQHQDHSYHQQQHQPQLFHVGNNIPNLNNIVFVSNNVPQITELQSATVSTPTNFTPFFDTSAETSEIETTNYLLNEAETSNVDNAPPQGQFRIRVKSLQELR